MKEEISAQVCRVPGSWVRNLYLLSGVLSFQGSSLPGPDLSGPRACGLPMGLVCITGLGSKSFNALVAYLGSGYLSLWGREAQGSYAPCPRPYSMESTKVKIGTQVSDSRSSALPMGPGTS